MSVNLFDQALIEEQTKRINLKKLCKKVDKINPDFSMVDINALIREMMLWTEYDHKVFQMFFIQGKYYKEIINELPSTEWKVKKSIRNSVKNIASNEDIFKK